MSISTKKKNIIIADFKAEKYTSNTELAKAHKISRSALYQIITDVDRANTDIVELGVLYEQKKKSTKNTHEIRAIEQAVALKVNTLAVDNELVKNNRKLLKGLQSSITGSMINKDGRVKKLEAKDIKSLTGAVKDIETIANPRESADINIQNNQTVVTALKIEFV